MKIKLYLSMIPLLLLFKTTNAQYFKWAYSQGGSSYDAEGVTSLAIDDAGNVYTTGFYGVTFPGYCDFDPGPGIYSLPCSGSLDAFIEKVDSSGNFVWARKIGSSEYDKGESITVDGEGNVYSTGRFFGSPDFDPGAATYTLTSAGNYDIYIQKLNSSGNFVWAKRIGSDSTEIANSIMVDGSGNVYTTGFFYKTVDFDPGASTFNLTSEGSRDVFIQKLDASGNFLWAKRIGSTDTDDGRSIALDASGNIYSYGSFSGTVDFDPGSGIFNLTGGGVYIQKIDPSGNLIWAKSMVASTTYSDRSLSVDLSGNVYTVGRYSGTVDFDPGPNVFNLTLSGIFIQKLDINGNFIWARAIKSTGESFYGYETEGSGYYEGEGYSIDVDGFQNVFITGGFNDYNNVDFDPGAGTYLLNSAGGNTTNEDIFVEKLDPSGNLIWVQQLISSEAYTRSAGNAIAADDKGNVCTGGFAEYDIDFDPGEGIHNVYCQGFTVWKWGQCAAPIVTILPAAPECLLVGATLTADVNETVTYQWLTYNNGIIPGATNESYTPAIAGEYKVEVTNQSGCSYLSPAALIFTTLATISASDTLHTCKGAGFSLYSNYGTFYQWFKDGIIIPGATSSGYYSSDFPDPIEGVYTVQVVQANGCSSISPSTTVVEHPLPIAVITPAGSFTRCSNQPLILSANSGIGLTYQWYNGYAAIPGATNQTYSANATGEYAVQTFNNYCVKKSKTTSLIVNPAPTATITPNTPVNICAGLKIVLTANGGAGLTYQWIKDGSNISGATNKTYQVMDQGNYKVQVTNTSACSATSSATTVNVNALPTATITPSGTISICSGATTTLMANTGSGLTYKWFKDAVAISGATNSTYSASVAAKYTVEVTNSSGCSLLSAGTILNVDAFPVASISPSGTVNSCEGVTTKLTANTGAELTYQWVKDGANISGATAKSYSTTIAGQYKVKVTNSTGCSTTSAVTTLNVNAFPTATITPSGTVSICSGSSITLTANTGSGLTYKWFKDAVAISGATNSTYAASVAAKYTVEVTNSSGCSLLSAGTILNVVAFPVASISPSGTVNSCEGVTTKLTASSGAGLTYQWVKDGANISGATAKTYSTTVAGQYKVKVTNTTGCSTTSPATTLNVNALPAATVTPSGTVSICNGATTTLTANAGTGLTYKWLKNKVAISGATNKTYTTTTTESGNYTVEVTNSSGCSLESAITKVTRLADPNAEIIILNGGNLDLCLGEVKLKGPGPIGTTWQWFKGANSISGATDQNYLPAEAGTYKVQVTNTSGCSKKSDNGVVVTKTCKQSLLTDEEQQITATIYPNPTTGTFSVNISNLTEENITITVLSLLGQVIYTQQYVADEFKTAQIISLGEVADGIYMVQILAGEKLLVTQIVIQR